MGTHIDLSHVAATPVGIRVTAQLKLVAVEDRNLRFKVECRDEKEIFGTDFPASAAITAAGFADPAIMIEIQAVAVAG